MNKYLQANRSTEGATVATRTERKASQNRLKAMEHPLRAAIFKILTERTASPAEMTRHLKLGRKDLVNVNYHTKELVKLGCAEMVEERRNAGKPSEKFYKATERSLIETDEWDQLVADDPVLAEHLLGEFMQVQLDDYVLAWKQGTLGKDDKFHMSRTRRVVDERGLDEALELYEQAREGMDQIEQRSAERRSAEGRGAVHISSGFGLFKVPAPDKR